MDDGVSDLFSLSLGLGSSRSVARSWRNSAVWWGCQRPIIMWAPSWERAMVRMMRIAAQPRSLVVSWMSLSKLWSSSSRAWAVYGHSDSRWVSESVPSQFRQVGLRGRSA